MHSILQSPFSKFAYNIGTNLSIALLRDSFHLILSNLFVSKEINSYICPILMLFFFIMKVLKYLFCILLCAVSSLGYAKIEGSLDPDCVVAEWSNSSTYPKVIDINFSDEMWPGETWVKETGRDCPEWSDSCYVNAIIDVPANGTGEVKYPVLFHNCVFANKNSYQGYAGATAAFCRQYYLGETASGNSATTYNNWTVEHHKKYIEDNIRYNDKGTPIYGEAGFVQFCRSAAFIDMATRKKVSVHGWMEIDHIPYVERIQWAWSSTSWGRGIKCDVKIGDGAWKPLVWMGSDKHKAGYTVFSDQGYFMENVIDAHDVSIRWRIWDGDNVTTLVQTKEDGSSAFGIPIDSTKQQQAARVHKIQIFGDMITAEQADYARQNPVGNVGKLSDIGNGGDAKEDHAPDANAPVVVYTVAKDGSGDFLKIQDAIDAVQNGQRGIIYIRPGIYEENVYAGRSENKNKFISLIGEDKETTILTSSVDRGANNPNNKYYDCAALNVYTSRFYAENLTIRNTAGNVGQAEALFTNGDAHLFNNCILSGYQDTYKANSGGRGYFTRCLIEGATDFIYDGGLEWFEDCEIRCVQGGGYVTAAADASLTLTQALHPNLSVSPFYAGLFFRNCNVTAEEGVKNGAYYLGRPWKEGCGTMFIHCKLGAHINTKGWKEWDGTENKCSYFEYGSKDPSGALINTASRVSWSHQATATEVEEYMNPEFLFAKFSDVPFDYNYILKGAAVPMNFSLTSTGFSWESDDMAVAYIIYKDGKFAAITTSPAYSKETTDEAVYSVRSISRHGVTSPAVVAKEPTQLLAFPTAEGFGKFTTGGRGGRVVTVTSLTNDGVGSLRWAFSQYPGEPITIVFAVSGEIRLAEELNIKRSDWTLAGQTAPGEGIVITHNKVNVGGSQNFIVRNVRFRIGQRNTNDEILATNALGSENCSNYIFDHCSFGWSVEENMNTADSHFLTVQYCIVHEGLYNSGHSKGARGYGCQWGGSPATYHHNLLAHNKSRSPRFNGARGEDYVVFMEYINNVNYNFGDAGGCYGGENTAAITEYNGLNSAHECNFINNYYKPGPASSSASSVKFVNSSYARSGATSWAPAKWYLSGNVIEGNSSASANNWNAMRAETYSLAQIRSDERIVTATPYYKYTVMGGVGKYVPQQYMMYDYETAEQAYATVVTKAGTVNSDLIERRILKEAREGGATTYGGSSTGKGKGIIDTENDCEGFYAYTTDYVVPIDSDKDGMPDSWESENGLDPMQQDNNTLNADGYTALEVYLNGLMGEKMDRNFTTGLLHESMEQLQVSYHPENRMLYLSPSAIGGTLYVYSTSGLLLQVRQIDSVALSLADCPSGYALLQISGRGFCPRLLKVVL